MLKTGTTVLTIVALLIVSFMAPVTGQPPAKSGSSEPPTNTQASEKLADGKKPEKNQPDLKKVFDEETKKFKAESAEFDPVKLEIEKGKQQSKRGWTKSDVALITVFAVGIAVLVYLVVKYGKNCIETNRPNCNISTDENCYCERYEEENQSRGVRIP